MEEVAVVWAGWRGDWEKVKMVRVGGSTQLWWYIGLLVSSFLCTVQDQSVQSAVPSDLYDYLEKMDRDEEEAEEQVSSCACIAHKLFSSHVYMYMCMWLTVPLSQAQTWSFEINQEHLETLQRRYRVLYMCLYALTTSPLLSSSLSLPLSISLSLPPFLGPSSFPQVYSVGVPSACRI